jgi:abequosyltransferase
MTNHPILTIGIPTYNRAHLIGNTLTNILQQIPNHLNGQVDILISDNASTDNTAQVVESLQSKHPIRITYSRNAENLGYDRNVDLLFKKALGKYVWAFGDDDELKNGAISAVFGVLTSHPDVKAVLVNFDSYDSKLESLQHRVEISGDVLCTDPMDFLVRSESRYSLMSSLILEREAWNSEDLTEGMDRHWIHVYALFKILLRGPSYILSQPFVNYRQGSSNITTTNGDAILAAALSSCAIVSLMKGMGHDQRTVKQLLEKSRRYIFNLVKETKRLGLKDKTGAAKALISIYNTPTVWFKLLPLIYCPDIVYVPLFRLRKKVSSLARSLRSSKKV